MLGAISKRPALPQPALPESQNRFSGTAVLVRQVLGAIAQFEKASAVAKLAAARKRKRETEGRCEGRKPLCETRPEVVALAHKLRRKRPKGGQLSLCVRCRRSWPLRASSTSEASPTPPSLWLRCCGVRDPAPGVSVETSVVENGYLRNRPWAEDPSQSPNRDLP
jgi:hypothetical protein